MNDLYGQTDLSEFGDVLLTNPSTEQYLSIHMGEGSPEIFRLIFNREKGQVEAIIADGASIDQAARLFINQLTFYGQTLMDSIKVEEAKTTAIRELASQYPNDMEFGNKVRHYINDNSTNRSR
jgi:hypothetical protein